MPVFITYYYGKSSKGGVRGRNSGVAAAQPPGCVDATVALHACNPVSSYTKSYLLSHSHVSPNSTSMWTPGVDCPLGTIDSFVVDDIPEREVRTAVSGDDSSGGPSVS